MSVTTAPEAAAPNDILSARADERLTHAYEQIRRADEQLARLTEQLARMEQDAASHPHAVLRPRRSKGRPALRGLIGLVAAACIIGTALISQSSYGEAIKPAIAEWMAPYIGSVSRPTQPGSSNVQLAAVETLFPQATSVVVTRPQDAATPAPAAASSEMTQLLQTMARDLAALQQGIEELKAGQERMAGDNAKTVEQVRASQEQLARLVARVSEQDQRAKTPALPPRPLAEPARKPAPAPGSPQASSQARAAQPMQLQPR